jgi:hypothetical protein
MMKDKETFLLFEVMVLQLAWPSRKEMKSFTILNGVGFEGVDNVSRSFALY